MLGHGMDWPTWELVAKPALAGVAFLLAGLGVFAALAAARRRDRRIGARTRWAGAAVAGASCLVMAGVLGFQAVFFAITG